MGNKLDTAFQKFLYPYYKSIDFLNWLYQTKPYYHYSNEAFIRQSARSVSTKVYLVFLGYLFSTMV